MRVFVTTTSVARSSGQFMSADAHLVAVIVSVVYTVDVMSDTGAGTVTVPLELGCDNA